MICNSFGIDDIHAGRDDIQSHSALMIYTAFSAVMIYQVFDLDMNTPARHPERSEAESNCEAATSVSAVGISRGMQINLARILRLGKVKFSLVRK